MKSILIEGMPWDNGIAPVLVNELGHEWYEVEDFSSYLKYKELYSEYRAYIVRMKDGKRMYVLTDRNSVIFDTTNYEAMLYHIDAIWLSKKCD